MLCKGCGKEIPENYKYCPNCGAQAEQQNVVNNTKVCPDCGKEFTEDRFFCDSCGGKLEPIKPKPKPEPKPKPKPEPKPEPKPKPKKKKKALPVIIIIIILFIIIYFIGRGMNSSPSSDSSTDITDTPTPAPTMATPTQAASDDTQKSDDGSSSDSASTSGKTMYTYKELPDIASLDSDSRFTYLGYNTVNYVCTYHFKYSSSSISKDEYQKALMDYSVYIQKTYGYHYEKELSEQQAKQTGVLTDYLSKDNSCIALTASNITDYQADVTIFNISDSSEKSASDKYNFRNFLTYIRGREVKVIKPGDDVNMDNTCSFNINNITRVQNDDGSYALNAEINLKTTSGSCQNNADDFMVLAVDSDSKVLEDASVTSNVTDADGNGLSFPYSVSSGSYGTYHLFFNIPKETKYFALFNTNLLNSKFSGPVYEASMKLN